MAEQTASQMGSSWVGGPSAVYKVPLLSKVFVWSLIFEPLLFFVLFERTVSGLTSNVGRILQIIVIIALMLRLLGGLLNSSRFKVPFPNFASPLYINYWIYILLIIVAGFIGILSGAYDSPFVNSISREASGISKFVDSGMVRPILEYFITLYYFVYFAILPQYFLRTEKSVDYFFTVFKWVFIVSLLVGFIDFGFSSVGVNLVPRHISDWRMVGMRFHGLAGEPRQAFVYLFLGLSIFHLQAYFKGLSLNKWLIVAIIVAALMTQSASGLLAAIAFLALYALYSLGRMNGRSLLRLSILCILISVFLYMAIANSERLMMYLKSASGLWEILETREKIPYLMYVQMNNIHPIYDLTVKFRNFNILPIFIGSGLGSASVINNVYNPAIPWLNNPNSEFVRLLFESGIIGVYFFIMAFTRPVKCLTKHVLAKKQHEFMLLILLLLGCLFAVRGAGIFIYLGILIATFRVLTYRRFSYQASLAVNGRHYR